MSGVAAAAIRRVAPSPSQMSTKQLQPFGLGATPQNSRPQRCRGCFEYLYGVGWPDAFFGAVIETDKPPPGGAGEDRHDDQRTHALSGEHDLLVWRKRA
jgi:hypothetical protein